MKGDNYKNPMDKNELGEPLPSRNQTVGETPELTTVAGAPVENNQDSMTSGRRGPLMLQDIWFLEKLAHFDREVIPERRMHAKGSGATSTDRSRRAVGRRRGEGADDLQARRQARHH